MDTISQERRSENMRRIKSAHTGPELSVRKVAHRLGFRFRLHRKDLPGKPDLTFPKLRKVIFVHGCFWHQHSKCRHGRAPKSRLDYWQSKLERNAERDKHVLRQLRQLGWDVLVIWECETDDAIGLEKALAEFLNVED